VPKNPTLRWVKVGPRDERFVALCCADSEVFVVSSLGSPREFLLVHSAALHGQEAIAVTPA
jgi:hypothetical protein